MSKLFERVLTIEIQEDLHRSSVKKGKEEGRNNITYFLGNSVEILPHIVPSEPGMYFIDAHISGSDSGWNGKEFVPLMEELKIILKKNKGTNVFILDDARFWVGSNKPHDWAHISVESVLELFKKEGVEVKAHYLENDRYYVLT